MNALFLSGNATDGLASDTSIPAHVRRLETDCIS